MRLHRFYLNFKIVDEEIFVKDENLIHQWRNVFRYNVGSEIILFDGSGFEFDAIFKQLTNRDAVLQIVARKAGLKITKSIFLFPSLIKKDKMEWVVEKATELGVSKIVPIVSERSEKKGFNLMRAQKIAIEASEQSGRVEVPLIGDIEPLKDALESFQGEIVVFDLIGKPFSDAVSWLGGEKNNTPINIFVGPEGGWSPKEIEMFKVQKAQIFSLGQLTLRAETASIVALSKLGVL